MIADIWDIAGKDNALFIWIVCFACLLLAANQLIGLIQKFRPQWIKGSIHVREQSEFATQQDLRRVEEAFEKRIADVCERFEESVVGIRDWLKTVESSAHRERAGLHDRLNVIAEVLFELRGVVKGKTTP